ncbi:MAG: hypothetical protein NT031_19060, partial [Planctomycetota bacterium]|nr:hypothetical protein [Planctomycetota bacterium]
MPRAKLSNISLKQLLGELNRRKSKLADLIAQRADLDAQIAELEALTGTPAKPAKKAKRRGRKPGPKPAKKPGRKPKATRGKRGKPLAAFVQEALAAAPKGMDVRSIEKAVLAAGYVTKGKDLYNPIAAVLGKSG